MNNSMPCNHSHSLNHYLDMEAEEQRIQEEREAMIEARAKELMAEGGSCHPWTVANIFEALANIDQASQLVVSTYLTAAIDVPNNSHLQGLCVKTIREEISDYWLGMSKVVAEKELGNGT